MKLSIVIICWNDLKVIGDCLRSIYQHTKAFPFEVIVSDNGSTDTSLEVIRSNWPQAIIVENKANLGFARGNNAGLAVATGDYVLILNPDTIIHDRALEKLVAFAERQPRAGAFGCRVLNPDGSYQNPARPLPSLWGYLVAALYMRWLGRFSSAFIPTSIMAGPAGRSARSASSPDVASCSAANSCSRWAVSMSSFSIISRKPICAAASGRPDGSPVLPGCGNHPPGRPIGREIPDPLCAGNLPEPVSLFSQALWGSRCAADPPRAAGPPADTISGVFLLQRFRRTEAVKNRLNMYKVASTGIRTGSDSLCPCRRGTRPWV